jgi:hypothetical protein
MLAAATLAVTDPSLAGGHHVDVAREIGRALSGGISVGVGGLDVGVGAGHDGIDVDVGADLGRPPRKSAAPNPALTPRQILGLGQDRITRAFSELADADQRKIRTRCAEVLANAAYYDAALVAICQIIGDIR